MIGSFRETVEYWVSQTLHADLFIATGRRSNLDAQPTISAALESLVTADPDVEAVERFRGSTLPYRGPVDLPGREGLPCPARRTARSSSRRRATVRRPLREAIGSDAVLVSEPFANRFGAEVGSTIELVTPAGPRRFRVAAVYYDYSTDRGVVLMDRGTFVRHFGERGRPACRSICVPGAIRNACGRGSSASSAQRIASSSTPIGRCARKCSASSTATFAITYALEAIAILVAVLGITSTMITLMIERRRELATLRLARRRPAADPGHGDDRSGACSAWSARSSASSPASRSR